MIAHDSGQGNCLYQPFIVRITHDKPIQMISRCKCGAEQSRDVKNGKDLEAFWSGYEVFAMAIGEEAWLYLSCCSS